jgi:acetylornithine/N-succinyldiaminopimelate aminotransferase
MSSAQLPVFNPLPISFVRGEGIWLFDAEGKAYLDTTSGLGVCALGHAHPEVAETIADQAKKLIHCSNQYEIPVREQLAEKLTGFAQMEKAFFCNSGAEANEAAIKLARLYGHQKEIEHPEIIVSEKSFHGRTLATLSSSGNRKIQAGFEPLVTGFLRAPFDSIEDLEHIAIHHKNVCAVMLEPILGNGGVIIPDRDYLQKLRDLCNRHDWLLILDEIQTGLGRTGYWYNFQQYDIKPDIVTTAKALGNGIPIAACMTQGISNDLFKPGSHGSTFGGNPFVCTVANKVLDILNRDKLCQNAQDMGNYFIKNLREVLQDKPNIKDIRGQGLMIGIELENPIPGLAKAALSQNLLINVTAEKVIRFLPPLIINQEQVDLIIDRLLKTLKSIH